MPLELPPRDGEETPDVHPSSGETRDHVVDAQYNSPMRAANDNFFIESPEKRTGAAAIEDPVVRDWLKNVQLYQDYQELLFFYNKGYIVFNNNLPVLNHKELKGKTWREILSNNLYKGADNVYDCLSKNGVTGLPERDSFRETNERERKNKGARFLKEEVMLPDSLSMLLRGEVGAGEYGGGKKGHDWYNEIVLPDGTATNALEIKVAQKMNELGVKRTRSGLTFTNSEFAGQSATLSKILAESRSGGLPQDKTSLDVYMHYLPNLRKTGLIQESDFHVNERGKGLNNIRFKRKTAGDVNLRSSLGSAKYYFGRDKYIQNGEPIPEQTFTATLDDRTGGVFEEQNGVKRLKYTFPLITADEFEEEKVKIANKFSKEVNELTETEITQNTRKKLDKNEIKDYSATDYVSPYRGETPREYAKRVEAMSNGEATVNAINEIFMGAGLDHLSLGWGKKIRLAEAVRRIDRDEIIAFAKKHGVPGLQVFLASEVEKDWPEEVLAFSNKPESPALFEAYAPLLTDEDEFRNVIDTSIFKNDAAREYLADLRRASLEDVVAGIRRVIREGGSPAQVIAKSREGVLAKLSLVKALKKEGLLDSLEEIKGVRFDVCQPQEISPEDIQVARAIYAKNYASTPRLQQSLLHTFDESVADASGKERFFIFKHNDAVKGFYRLEETAPGHYYFGAFNVDPTYKGYKLGETMLAQSLDHKAALAVIDADCDREASVSSFYIESGFIATDAYDFEEAKAFHILRNDALQKEVLATADWNEEKIRAMAKVGETVSREGGKVLVSAFPRARLNNIPFDKLGEHPGNRYVLSRYIFPRDKRDDIVYAVFERVSEEDFSRLKNEVTRSEEERSSFEELPLAA